MYHLVVFQVLCGCFCAFVAARRGQGRLFWWIVGAFVPLLGVALCLLATGQADGERAAVDSHGSRGGRDRRRRPKRCCAHYVPECWGCPYFRRHLFGQGSGASRGHCAFFHKDLAREPAEDDGGVTIEDT